MTLDGLRLILDDIQMDIEKVIHSLCEDVLVEELNLRRIVADLAEIKHIIANEIILLLQTSEDDEEEMLEELLSYEDEDGSDD